MRAFEASTVKDDKCHWFSCDTWEKLCGSEVALNWESMVTVNEEFYSVTFVANA
jgi:hypothetical protein